MSSDRHALAMDQSAFTERFMFAGRTSTSRRPSTGRTTLSSEHGSTDSAVSSISTRSDTGKTPSLQTKSPIAAQRHQLLSFATTAKTTLKPPSPIHSPERRRTSIFLRSPVREKSTPQLRVHSAEGIAQGPTSPKAVRSATSDKDSFTSTSPYAKMIMTQVGGRYPSTMIPPPGASPALEALAFHHIRDTASKRIQTLEYLRKVHEGRVYWFGTLLFSKPDLVGMPFFESKRLARRATNYLLLGISLPTILDLNSSNASEFLRNLNGLLSEFESFQQIHPPDGSTSSSLSRARIPQMFKRTATSKPRRTSSAADIGLPMGNDASDLKSLPSTMSSSAAASGTSFAPSENDLLPGEEYSHLLTPSLPFDPDFYETFATLCDILIDCYTRVMSLAAAPKDCTTTVSELFTKADLKVRKIIVQSIIKEYDDSSRSGIRSEVAGVGKVVLGGLM